MKSDMNFQSELRKEAVVVVPVYKSRLNDDEAASFVHNANVLKNHDVVAVYPEGLDMSFYKDIAPMVRVKAFRKDDFDSVKRYNRLMTSVRFYQAFSEYEYLLICHFDAWVFRDELHEWCSKGYDYVGAPFREPFVGKLTAVFPFLAKICVGKVGNGGLCLRNVSTHIQITSAFRWLIPLCLLVMHEDVFFTLVVPLFRRKFRRPDAVAANLFSIEQEPEESVAEQGGNLPFGCHGWFKRNSDFWRKYIRI